MPEILGIKIEIWDIKKQLQKQIDIYDPKFKEFVPSKYENYKQTEKQLRKLKILHI